MKFSLSLIVSIIGAVLPACTCLAVNPRGALSVEGRAAGPSNATVQLQSILNQYNLPALGIAINPSFKFSLVGRRRIDRNVSIQTTDVFHMGSNTKSMVDTVLAMLIEDGKLSWQTPLKTLLPEFDMLPFYQNITVEMLTSMRSGITDDAITFDYFSDFTLDLYALSPIDGRKAMAKITLSTPSPSSQGAFNYANTNYAIIGLIIDAVTNSTTEKVVGERLWKPLKMNSAGWGGPPEHSITSVDSPWPHNSTVDGVVAVGFDKPSLYRDLPPGYNPAGLTHMTVEDWNKYLLVHLDGSHGKPSTVLNITAATFEKLHTGISTADLPAGYPAGSIFTYGGWLRQNYANDNQNYNLSYCGSNDRNYACVTVDSKAGKAFSTVANIGAPANVILPDLIAAMRNGTIVL